MNDCIAAAVAGFPALIGLAPLLPLGAALLILAGRLRGVPEAGTPAGDAAEPATVALASGSVLGALLLVLAAALARLLAAPDGAGAHVVSGVWFAAGPLVVRFSFLPDTGGLAAAAVVLAVGWPVLRFSAAYLHREPAFHRFFAGLCLLLAGLLLIALAGNAVLAFVGWELAGFASWWLIGYAEEQPVATGNALWAFLANRVGDAGFLLGIGLAWWWAGSVEWPDLTGGVIDENVQARLLLLGFVVAALAKSAQLPFTPWIGRALEGPTPSSAIFYGALLVHAGVFLLWRVSPLFALVPDLLRMVGLAGAATLAYAWGVALVQSDAKSAQVFAGVGVVGLLFVLIGAGAFALAGGLAAAHALYRVRAFLRVPSVLDTPAPPPRPAPASGLYTALVQRLWLDPLAEALLVRPTLSLGQDVTRLDARVIDRLVGVPRSDPEAPLTIAGHGLAGRALQRLADVLQRLEDRLVLQGRGGAAGRLLARAASVLVTVETLLEQPRYLMLMVMATFVVIL